MQSSPRARWTVAAAACCAGVLTALYRFLATASFPNDEHEYLAGAQQILLAGEWPTRDFFDPGRPLMYVASAAAQVVFGHTLFAEAVLTSVALGLAAALVLIAAHRLSTSLFVAAIATLLCVALFPRPYAYPKILLYAAGPLVMWAWLAKPTFGRIFGMAAIVVIAFLLRHDHGVYLGGAVAATVLLAPANGSRERLARLATFGALVVVLALPYIIYVETSEGLGNFLRAASAYSSREADRTALRLDEIDWGHDARLFYGYYLLPIAMLACFAIDWRRHRRVEPAVVVPLAALALVINVGFLRDPLAVRLPDAAVLPALCGAWLAGRGLQASTRWRRVTAVSLLAIVTALATSSIIIVGNVCENLNRTDLGRGLSVRANGTAAAYGRTPGTLCAASHSERPRHGPRAVLRVSRPLHNRRAPAVRRRIRAGAVHLCTTPVRRRARSVHSGLPGLPGGTAADRRTAGTAVRVVCLDAERRGTAMAC